MYEDFDSFHKGGVKKYRYITLTFLILSKLDFMFRARIPRLKFEANILEIIFTKNQLKSSDALDINGTDRLIFNENITNTNGYIISNFTLFKLSLRYSKRVHKVLKSIKGESLLKKNVFRVVRLVVIEELLKNLKLDKVKTIVQYNDHSPFNLMVFHYFNKRKIKTIYCQHAPVSYKFPILYHDLNLLFSEDSLEKYEFNGPSKKKYLIVGDIRFWNKTAKKKKIHFKMKKVALICFNKLDSVESVLECATFLNENDINVIIRKHPADDVQINGNERIIISQNLSLFDDLNQSNLVITNESAVPLESIFMDLPTYIYRFRPRIGAKVITDNYSFIKKGLIKKDFKSKYNLLTAIENLECVYDKSKLSYFLGPISKRVEIKEIIQKNIKQI